MQDQYKEVRFDIYCETCEYKDNPDKDDPCNGCLENPMNLYSEKPVNYKEKQTKKQTKD